MLYILHFSRKWRFWQLIRTGKRLSTFWQAIFYLHMKMELLHNVTLWNSFLYIYSVETFFCDQKIQYTVYRVLHIFCPGNKDQFFKEEVSLNSSPMPQAWPDSKLSNYITVFYFEGLFYSSGKASPFRFKMQT